MERKWSAQRKLGSTVTAAATADRGGKGASTPRARRAAGAQVALSGVAAEVVAREKELAMRRDLFKLRKKMQAQGEALNARKAEKQRRTRQLRKPNDYVVPTSKRRDEMRWSVRVGMMA